MVGAFTGYFDVAQVVLYVFWLFFAGLVYYLHREDKREGYPLESERHSGRYRIEGFPAMPPPKTYLMHDGHTVTAPREERDERPIMARAMNSATGAPLVPTGNPMIDAVGPAAYAQRWDEPDSMLDGKPLLFPMRLLPEFSVAKDDPDPRGMLVFGADNKIAGRVHDVWVDRAEPQIRYLEVTLSAGGRTVMLPIHFSKFDIRNSAVRVRSILSTQFADVPALRNPDVITMLEEDKISAYYAGGTLYATPARSEPFI
jgi:photosynthetic reaction center H subunit